MPNLLDLLQTAGEPLDGLSFDGDEARTQLTLDLLPAHAQTFAGLPIAIYLRISDDKNEDMAGVRRQAVDAIRHALVRGAACIAIYEENDTSAFKKRRVVRLDPDGNRYYVWRVIRPRWQNMLVDLRSGKQRGAVVYDIDRLARDPRDLEDAIELAEYYRRRFEGTTGSLNLTTPDGIAMARVMVAMASKSSADTSRRTKRKHLELAENGSPVGGLRPFGWNADKRTINEEEAKEIRHAVERILAGVGTTAIMAEWHERGIKTPHGNSFRWSAFMGMLRNPRLCGLRSRWHREIDEQGREGRYLETVTKPDGTEVKGQWDPILDRATWDALIAKIGDRGQPREDYRVGAKRKYLLTGLTRCGKCEHHPPMWGTQSTVRGKPHLIYQCASKPQGGCGSNSRKMEWVDEVIRDLVFARCDYITELGGSPEREEPEDDPAIQERLDEIEELLGDLYAEWKSKTLPSKDYFAMRKDLTEERDELTEERAKVEVSTVTANLSVDVRHHWGEASLEEKRAFIERYLQAVVVHPIVPVWNEKHQRMALPPSNIFDPSLIEPVWR